MTVTVPANSGNFFIPEIFMVIDDDINEIEKSFAVVAAIGADVPDEVTCFLQFYGERVCLGRQGATEIRITDNDRKCHSYHYVPSSPVF